MEPDKSRGQGDQAVSPSRPALKQLSDLAPQLAIQLGMVAHLRNWKSGGEAFAFDSVFGSVRSLLGVMLSRFSSHVLLIVPQAVDADIVTGDCIALGCANSLALPLSATDGTPDSIRDADYAERLQVLQRLRARRDNDPEPLIITAYVGAAMQLVPTPGAVSKATRKLFVGAKLDDAEFKRWLAEAGFHATTAVQLPGEFSQRGGILDVFSPDQPTPIRVELFDDEIESLRRFDPSSQRSIESISSVEIAAVGGGQDSLGPFTDYLPDDTVVVFIDPGECQKSANALLHRLAETSQFLSYESLVQTCHRYRLATAASLGEATGDQRIDLRATTVESFVGAIDQTKARVDSIAAQDDVFVVGDTPADSQRLHELLADTRAATQGRLHLAVAGLSGGFRLVGISALVLTGAELFHRSPIRRGRSRSRGKPIDSLTQLESGDLVVHLAHGIGLYRGLRHIEKNGQQQEHLALEFDEGTLLYVPASRIGLIQRYVGGGSSRPRLAKIGGQSWGKTRKAVESAVIDMADELLELQASRASKVGITFAADGHWQHQFDASFPYVPTHDQVTAIDACKDDMERSRPMDRLICGDVGYGKTEVAMRAAFKAVVSGYQVAVLVPTTVLAEQHFHSFQQRMAEFPVEIAKLSRFVSAAEQKETVKQLRSGKVDIVIGTHRLASKDVDFSNLGLVIIDEEQRFGVEVKERLKSLHRNVDVLTLSATPIPRTLHMALVGVRDISNLETPPEERMAVETRVGRWDEKVIRSAIVRELNRGGQIFFVHNRIGDMHLIADKLQRIVPEIRLITGHGQMDEHELEKVMVDFVEHRYDLLLATTIIESGLDIPNANTIFINDADHYGLSELHQLRGRVGRYKHQAYCYLMVAPHKHLTPEASKRLRAIEEFSQMGAGFAISMRDLEIRGAGNLLGTQQSGHIAAIGYELYCQLLEDAVRRAQNLPPKISAEVDIDLPIEAVLPPDYVADLRHKIDLYRRIARIDHVAQVDEIRQELVDRFGPLPIAATRMLKLAELRLDAALWQVSAITSDNRFMVLHYSDRRRMEQLSKRSPVPVRIVDEKKAYVPIHQKGEGGVVFSIDPRLDFDQPSGQAWLDLAFLVFTGAMSDGSTEEPEQENVKVVNSVKAATKSTPVQPVAKGKASQAEPAQPPGQQTRKPLPAPRAKYRYEKKGTDAAPLSALLRSKKPNDPSGTGNK